MNQITTVTDALKHKIASSVGIKSIPEDWDYETCEAMFNNATKGKRIMSWVQGDILRHVEKKWDEKYSQLLDPFKHSSESHLNNIKWVCNKVNFSLRKENLTFSHHIEVAPLEQKEQEKYLEIADKDSLSVRQLRDLIHCDKNPVKEVKCEILPPDKTEKIKQSLTNILDDEVMVKKIMPIVEKQACEVETWETKHKSLEEKYNELEKKYNNLTKENEEKDKTINGLRAELKGLEPSVHIKVYKEYWNELNKDVFGHLQYETKDKDGNTISKWPKEQNIILAKIIKRFGDNKEVFESFLKYCYGHKFYKRLTQPHQILKNLDMILKERKVDKGDDNIEFVMKSYDIDEEVRKNKEAAKKVDELNDAPAEPKDDLL